MWFDFKNVTLVLWKINNLFKSLEDWKEFPNMKNLDHKAKL